ncbi:alkane 1-monooxygenase [Pseudovibrio sp. SPO723]|uniref:alkane 1-monooxygenase n=1 Tax=Nesiotobacter zosterae TaxID=392721 RepID=UPI0029C10742|nr:alkane 1-monooxygenase [Pseudovibrio sp. SPO723]MDX5595280.1 alkane 1-monooxygenase [Pseudovibrio sp. SPO723]
MHAELNDLTNNAARYRNGKRYLWLIAFVTAFLPIASMLVYVETGFLAALCFPVFYFFVGMPLLDMLFGEDPYNPSDDVMSRLEQDPYFRVLLFCIIPIYYLTFFAAVWVVGTYSPPLWAVLVFAVGVGTFHANSLTVGHELGHKTNKVDQWGAKISNALVGYGHFCIEHNRGHHVQVATPEDAASSRFGESIYRFALREIPGGFVRGWHHEAERLKRKGHSVWSWRNDILQGYAITLAIAAGLVVWFGPGVLPFIIVHHVVGWYGLTQANYVEHYGLKRKKMENGRYEPCQPRHSWNTNHIYSNLATFHLQRHSDHHSNPLRPYQVLRNFPDLPRLPSGYPGCFVLAAIPPLWFRIMNPKVMAWANNDPSLINKG